MTTVFRSVLRVLTVAVLLLALCLAAASAEQTYDIADESIWTFECDSPYSVDHPSYSKAWYKSYHGDSNYVLLKPVMWTHRHEAWNAEENRYDYATVTHYVTSVGHKCFYGLENLVNVTLAEGMTEIIGKHQINTSTPRVGAFLGCTSLTSVSLPSTLHTIGEYAFTECSALTTIALPVGLRKIDGYAFAGCTSLNNIVCPPTLAVIGDNAFDGCTSLADFRFNSGLESIGKRSFAYTVLEDITLPDSVTAMNEAFFLMSKDSLKHLRWSGGVPVVTDFSYHTALESVEIPEGVTEIDIKAFYKCPALVSVSLPSTLLKIGHSAFCECDALESIQLPEGLEELGGEAFGYCDVLNNVVIPSTITTMGDAAFRGCPSLTKVTLSDGLTLLADFTFYNSPLEEVILPDSITTLGWNVFNYVSVFPNETIKHLRWTAGIPVVPQQYFDGAVLESVELPEGVTGIEDRAFSGCKQLTSITLPRSLTYIGPRNFISTIEIRCHYAIYDDIKDRFPNTVMIDNVATLPADLTTIGSCAFANIAADVIVIPPSVTEIAEDAFDGCDNLLLSVTPDTPAAAWAEAHTIPFVIR